MCIHMYIHLSRFIVRRASLAACASRRSDATPRPSRTECIGQVGRRIRLIAKLKQYGRKGFLSLLQRCCKRS